MYKICFYVQPSHLEQVKQALFAAGAGKIGHYSHCAWEVLGQGQYMPLEHSKPFIGQQHEIAKEAEYKVEMVCENHCIRDVIAALKINHPYETPAYQVIKMEEL